MARSMTKIGKTLLCTALVLLTALSGIPGVPTPGVSAAAGESFNIPANGKEIRNLTIKHVKDMAHVEWTCAEDIDFSQSTDWTQYLVYKKGVKYTGMPYISGRMDGDSDVFEFREALDKNGVYVGPTTWQTMIGSDCGGAPRLGFAWSGALLNCSPGNDFSYEPLQVNFDKEGLAPLGDYNWQAYDISKKKSTAETIMATTGAQKMYECYALAEPADVVWSYFITGEHIRMVAAKAETVRNADGTIDGKKSWIRFVEQTSGISYSGNEGTTWGFNLYSYEQLFNEGYIPMTMKAYSKTSVERPEFSTDGVNLSGKVSTYNFLSGRINCNYNIFKLVTEVTDGNGKAVTTGTMYPYMITADLSRTNYSVPLTSVKAGKYHVKMTATIGFGTKVLIDEDVDYQPVEELAVYVSDTGTGDGSSPDKALGNAPGYDNENGTAFKNSALYRAVELLSHTGGTVVVCGKTTIKTGHYYGTTSTISDFCLPGVPVDGVTVKITSSYGGVDYRTTADASVTVKRSSRMATNIELKIATEWDDVDLVIDNDYQAPRDMVVACCNKKTVFGKGFRTRVISDGFELEASRATGGNFPIVCGGYRYSVDPGNTDLTVLGGCWKDIAGGPCGVDSLVHGILDGGVKLTIGGKTQVFGDVYGASRDTCGSVSGDVEINIEGGTVNGKIYLGGHGGFSTEGRKAVLNVTGVPKLTGEVLVIAPGFRHVKPAETVLNFKDARGKSVLPSYNKESFTTVIEQVIDPAFETDEPEDDETEGGKTTAEPKGTDGEKPSSGNKDTFVTVCAACGVVCVGAIAFAVISLTKKKK